MRVVLLNQYYAPDEAATAQMLADVGAGLAEAGHEVVALCSARSYADPKRRYSRRETIAGVEIRRTATTGFGRGTRMGRLFDYATFVLGAAGRLLLLPEPDVVLSLSTPPLVAALGLWMARLRGARSLYWVMDVYPDLAFELGALRRGSVAGQLVARMSRFALRRSDRVIALGECMAERLRALGAPDNVVVIHNWADGEAIRPRPVEDHPFRAEWGWDGRFVVLYSGNMGLAHEFETVAEAAEHLRGHSDVLFAFVGGGPRRAELEERVRALGLANVEFRPYVERHRLGESLTAGDVHLVTLRERMPGLLVPSKIYGILAAGRPTIYVGPDRGEVADIVREGRCGTRVTVGDGEGLAQAVLAYREDAVRREREGQAARDLFDRRFTRPRGISAFLDLIKEKTVHE